MLDPQRLEAAYQTALAALRAERKPDGYWVGELSTSALSTATGVGALALVARDQAARSRLQELVKGGLSWLATHQNADGGWGDTDRSVSNISTTMLCRASLLIAAAGERRGASPPVPGRDDCLRRASVYLDEQCGPGTANHATAIRKRYGKDRTFSVPILLTAALAGLMPWHEVPALPFELACLPQAWFRFLRLPVVSYALPALIALGQAIHHHRPPRNPLTRLIRWLSRKRILRVLEQIQPSSGGFLEAVPLTSFVVMSLASIGQADHPVARKGVEFLVNAVRPDGSWPIDSNLSVWVTTLSINALAAADGIAELNNIDPLMFWLEQNQNRQRHPYSGADPGGWGWTHLPGSVPDADDTSGALLALSHLWCHPAMIVWDGVWTGEREREGCTWLLQLQNRNGGWPTFCRGWGKLPFDRSGSDLTAHALRALHVWEHSAWLWKYRGAKAKAPAQRALQTVSSAIQRGLSYLANAQRPDGSWLPLWFGNQHAPQDENPTYGTARVLAAYRDLHMMDNEPARRGVAWLLTAQNADGGWGGDKGVSSSVEETALAVEVLLDAAVPFPAVERGLSWLIDAVEAGRLKIPEPMGFYFAKLWYYEKLYPVIFTVAALGRARRKLREG